MNILDLKREKVELDFRSAQTNNAIKFAQGDTQATREYIFQNQQEDALQIVNQFLQGKRIVSVSKKTKVGMDGLIIEVCHQLCTLPDNHLVVDPDRVRIITAMSNLLWQRTLRDKAPACFKPHIFHHGQLTKCDFSNLQNGLLIIDEIDCGDKEQQVLHQRLQEAGILDIKYITENNLKIMVASATLINHQYQLAQWGTYHYPFTMSIPPQYIGHKDFLERGLLQPFFPMTSVSEAARWIQEDCLDNYGDDARIHIIRCSERYLLYVEQACKELHVAFRNHTSEDRIDQQALVDLFETEQKEHVVIAIKGFFRRADFIPDAWKMRIGAVHEQYTKVVNDSVQIQGLPGRMSGYWRHILDRGHRTGPYRTSLDAIRNYEGNFIEPYGEQPYQTSDFKKVEGGRITKLKPSFLSAENILHLDPSNMPGELALRGEEDGRKRVPAIVSLTDVQMADLFRMKVGWSDQKMRDKLIELIKQMGHDDIDQYRNTYTIMPGKQGKNSSYKKTCGAARHAHEHGQPFFWTQKSDKPYPTENICHIYVDKYEKQLCICMRDGVAKLLDGSREGQTDNKVEVKMSKPCKLTKSLETKFCKRLIQLYESNMRRHIPSNSSGKLSGGATSLPTKKKKGKVKAPYVLCIKCTKVTFERIWMYASNLAPEIYEKVKTGETLKTDEDMNPVQVGCLQCVESLLTSHEFTEGEKQCLSTLVGRYI